MCRIATILAIGMLLAGTTGTGVAADDYRGNWHGDIHHFDEYDAARWHGGYWADGFHGGREGWWWVVDMDWYYYPSPVYPYPDPYIPYAAVPVQPVSPVPQYWYCQNPAGYYPYVPACYVQWQPVPTISQPMAQTKTAVKSSGQRDKDDRELNRLAGEYYGIHASDKGALKHIKGLQVRVEEFHDELFSRDYNAMDILKDTENLEKRIASKETEISGMPKAFNPGSGNI